MINVGWIVTGNQKIFHESHWLISVSFRVLFFLLSSLSPPLPFVLPILFLFFILTFSLFSLCFSLSCLFHSHLNNDELHYSFSGLYLLLFSFANIIFIHYLKFLKPMESNFFCPNPLRYGDVHGEAWLIARDYTGKEN